MTGASRLRTVFLLCLVSILIVSCGGNSDQSVGQPVGDCNTNPLPGIDCACFNETTGQEQYASIARKLEDVAQLNRGEVDTDAMQFNQKDVDEMLALIGDVETDCAAQH